MQYKWREYPPSTQSMNSNGTGITVYPKLSHFRNYFISGVRLLYLSILLKMTMVGQGTMIWSVNAGQANTRFGFTAQASVWSMMDHICEVNVVCCWDFIFFNALTVPCPTRLSFPAGEERVVDKSPPSGQWRRRAKRNKLVRCFIITLS